MRRKRLFCFLLGLSLLVISLMSSMTVSAGLLDGPTPEETTGDSATDTSYSLLRGSNLSYGTVEIKKLSQDEVHLYGLTQCHHECAVVYLDLFLERKVDGSYATYKSWNFDATNMTSLEKGLNVIVPSGYYYRLRGYHAAKDGSKESTETLTQGIWVG